MILIIFVCDITGFHHLNCKDKKRDQADFLRSDAVQSSEEECVDVQSSEEETVGADAVESSEAHSHNLVPSVPLALSASDMPVAPKPLPSVPAELDDETKEWSDMSDGEQTRWIFANRSEEQAERWMLANHSYSETTHTACCSRGLKRKSNQEQNEQRLPTRQNNGNFRLGRSRNDAVRRSTAWISRP